MSTKKATKETVDAGEKQEASKDVFVSRQLAKPYDVTVEGKPVTEGKEYTIIDSADQEHLIFRFEDEVSASDVQVSSAIAENEGTLKTEGTSDFQG